MRYPPNPAWDQLIWELGLEPFQLTCQLLHNHGAPSLMTRPVTFTDLVSPSATNSAKTLLLRQSSSGDPTCTLVIVQSQVAMLCDLREMFEMNPQCRHCATQGGDSHKIAGQAIFLSLCEQPSTACCGSE
jgi:hypothetical protein